AEDQEVAARLNRRLEDLLIYLIENYRDALSAVISETIEQWDPVATAERIELHIGRDLQFIRINGTLVGGLVGVLIHVVWGAIAGPEKIGVRPRFFDRLRLAPRKTGSDPDF